MKEEAYNIIKTKNKTQELNVKAILRSPKPCYDCEHGSSESIRNQASGEIVSLKISSQIRKLVSRYNDLLETIESSYSARIRVREVWSAHSLSESNKAKSQAKELWDSLESKYMAEDVSSKKFFKDFKHTLKHDKDDLSLVQLGSHVRIEECLRAQNSDKCKGKEVVGPSLNMTEEDGKNRNNKQNKGKKCGSNENNGGPGSNKKPKLECWKCGKTGHFKRECRSENKRTTQMLVVQEKGLRTNPKTKVDAIAWWIDSGATTHVCKDRCLFKTYEPVEDGSVLYMSDGHFALVHGKGSVVMEFGLGKSITLFNVLYVQKLHKNLIFGPVLNKCGYKQVYESDKYILLKTGVFVGFGYYNNGMFMLNLNKVPDDSGSVYMSSSTVVNSSLWHARLGHVHYKRMFEMSKMI
ncbi:zinc finger, CCHC-type containing protein [Tanacetum coccineum]